MLNTHTLPQVIAQSAVRTVDQFDGNLEDCVIHHTVKARKKVDMTDSQANALFFHALDIATNMPFEDRAIYVKEIGTNTEKWYDPLNGRTYWVTNRDFNNAKEVR